MLTGSPLYYNENQMYVTPTFLGKSMLQLANEYLIALKKYKDEQLARATANRVQPELRADNISTWLKLLDLKKAIEILQKKQEARNLEAAGKAATGLLAMASPSTYAGFAIGNMSGTGTGNEVLDLLTDATVFGGLLRNSKTLLKSQNLSKFINSDNKINIPNSVEAIKEGKNWAILYLQSPIRKQTNQHNFLLALRLGFKLFRPFNEASERVSVPNKIKIVNEPNNLEGGSVWTDSKDPALDEITINVSLNPYYSSLHENLHRGYVGNAPKEYYLNEPRGTFGDTNRFYEFLKEKTLKPWSERSSLPGADYLDKPEELAVNLIEAGLRMGLKIGLPYPGKAKALEIMNNYRLSGDYKSGVIDLLNLNKPKRAWKGLTGTLFSLPLVYGYMSNGLKNIQ